MQDGNKNQQIVGGNCGASFPIFSDPVSSNDKKETLGVPQATRVLQEKAVTEAGTATAVKADLVATTARPEVLWIILYMTFLLSHFYVSRISLFGSLQYQHQQDSGDALPHLH